MKIIWPDLLSLALLLFLLLVFYWPETDVLRSRYVMTSGPFERAGRLVNPDYTDTFKYNPHIESKLPLSTLTARWWVGLFPSNLARAVLCHHITWIVAGALLTYAANRCFLSVLVSLFLTVFLVFDRTLMPLARGVGVSSVLMLIPLILLFLRCLASSQERSAEWRKRLGWGAGTGLCLALMYCLGSHEGIFALAFLAGFCFCWRPSGSR